jgi:hypothetical protein
MAIHACCMGVFQMFHLFFKKHVASVFIWMLHMLQMFYLDVAYACNDFLSVFK